MLRGTGISILERERRRRGLTALDLGERMGVSRSAVSQVERAWLRPSDAFKEKAAKALGLDVQRLFPALWFLTTESFLGTNLVGPDGRMLAFTSGEAAAEAARLISGCCERRVSALGPAPVAFFALMHGEDEDEVVGRLNVDPELGELPLGSPRSEKPAGEPALVAADSAGVGDGYDSEG